MAVNITETNRRKRCLIFSGFSYRIDSVLKNGDISWRCTNNIARCKARIRTDESGKTFVNAVTEHNHPSDLKILEAQQLQVQAKRSGDKEKNAYVLEKFHQYHTKEISRSEFIHAVGCKFTAVTNL